MTDAFNRVFDAASFEAATKVLILVLLIGAAGSLWEIIRYVRALRKGRDLATRRAYQRMVQQAGQGRGQPIDRVYRARGGLMRRSVHAVGILAILLLVTAAAAMPFLGTWLEHQDYPEKADYIVALPGDGHQLLKAAELFQQGFAPKILLGSEPQKPAGRLQKLRSEIGYPNLDPYEFQLRVLEKDGVPRAATASLGASHAGILGAAEALKTIVEDRRLKIIVVASASRSLRTKVIFQDVLPRARFIVVSPAEGGREPWWSNQDAALATVGEATRLAHYWVASGLRALLPDGTPSPSQAGAPRKPAESSGAGTNRP